MSFIPFQKAFDVIEEVESNGLPQGLEKLKEIKNDVIIDKKLSNIVSSSSKSEIEIQIHRDSNPTLTRNPQLVAVLLITATTRLPLLEMLLNIVCFALLLIIQRIEGNNNCQNSY